MSKPVFGVIGREIGEQAIEASLTNGRFAAFFKGPSNDPAHSIVRKAFDGKAIAGIERIRSA